MVVEEMQRRRRRRPEMLQGGRWDMSTRTGRGYELEMEAVSGEGED